METYQIILLIMAVVLLIIILIVLLLPKKKEGNNLIGELKGSIKEENFNLSKTIIKEKSPYENIVMRSIAKMEKDEKKGVSPDKVVKVIYKVINRKRMPIQVVVGFDYKLLVLMSKWLPKRLVEFIITKMYG